MAKQTINLGTSANKGDGDPLRTAFDKVNDNFDELYARDLNTDAQTLELVGNTLSISDGNSVDLSAYLDDTQFSGDYDDLTNKPDLSVLDGDLTGSVFADDSSVMVDAVNYTLHATNLIIGNGAINNRVSDGSGVQVEASQDVEIKVNDGGNSYIWSFEPGGIQFPDSSVQTGASISVADLQTLVAASTDFNDFKSRIAAL